MLSPAQTWLAAIGGVGGDHGVMFLDGVTFGQIPSLHAYAKGLGSEYGSATYYAMFTAGAALPALVVTAITVASTVASGGTVGAALGLVLVGAAVGGGMAVAGQGMEMLDGRREAWDFDASMIIGGAGMGGLMGALSACSVPAAVSTAARVGFGALALSGSADAFARGDVFTGVFGLATAGLPFMLGRSCFVAGTPIRTPTGSTPIERLRRGDVVLSRPEDDAAGPVARGRVLHTFVRSARVVEVVARGRAVLTTGEHPFWVAGMGWTRADRLVAGDCLVTSDGREVAVESARGTDRFETVYNVEVEGLHTYFVGDEAERGFDLWAHNASKYETLMLSAKNGQSSRGACCTSVSAEV